MEGTALTATEFASAVTAITSAFGDPTRRDIYLFARECEQGVTAAEVAQRFELHANVARHHLDKLSGGGYLEVAIERSESGGAGRPSKRYRVTSDAMPLEMPVRHDDVLVSLLGRALKLLTPAQAMEMAEEVGIEYGRTMAEAMGPAAENPRSFRTALHSVADALTAHGFASHAVKSHGTLRLVSEHCPFDDATVEHPVICAVDRGMVKGMLATLYDDTSPSTEASIPMGDDHCVTAIAE